MKCLNIKKILLIPATGLVALIGTGCATMEPVTPAYRVNDNTVCQQYRVKRDEHNIAGTVVGGALGGLLGNQFGSGTGQSIATGVGAAGGAVAGNKIQQKANTGGYETKCFDSPDNSYNNSRDYNPRYNSY